MAVGHEAARLRMKMKRFLIPLLHLAEVGIQLQTNDPILLGLVGLLCPPPHMQVLSHRIDRFLQSIALVVVPSDLMLDDVD